jgi:hypothetical protein
MVAGGRRYQAATQVKGLSLGTSKVIEADMVHMYGRQHRYIRNGEGVAALSGSETVSWYQRGVWEPGRSRAFFHEGVVVDNPKRKGNYDDALEVGPIHSRGVVRAMPGEGVSSLEGVGSYTQKVGRIYED